MRILEINEKGKKSYLISDSHDKEHIFDIIESTKSFYEKEMLRDCYSRVFLSRTAIDVGAHIGNHTIYFSHIMGMKVYAFAPLLSLNYEKISPLIT